jgi:predicted RNA binding protein YcfA (HicA-like mRNA interferase family)
MARFPTVKARQLIAALEEVGYTVTRQTGSHRHLTAKDKPRVTISYANGDDVPPGVSRKVLARIVGLDEDEAVRLLEER